MGARTRASTLNERREKNFGAVHAAQMDDGMDEKIRVLLTACFTGPQDAVFQTRRYFHDPYPHRWIVRDERGNLAAHVGVHERCMVADGRRHSGGIDLVTNCSAARPEPKIVASSSCR